MAPDPTRVLARHFALEVAGRQDGFVQQVSGGGAHTDVVENAGANLLHRIGTVRYNDIVLTVGAGASGNLYQWIAETVDGKGRIADGAVQFCDAGYKVLSRLDWYGGIISAINFPALDATSKDRAAMTVKIATERTAISKESTDKVTAIDTPRPWMANGFRLQIEGLESACRKVSRIETLTLIQSISRGETGSGRKAVIGSVTKRTLGDLVVTLPQHAAQPFYDWHDLTREHSRFEEKEKNGQLTYLGSNQKSEYFTLKFTKLGMKSMTIARSGADTGYSPVTVEMYVETIQFECAR